MSRLMGLTILIALWGSLLSGCAGAPGADRHMPPNSAPPAAGAGTSETADRDVEKWPRTHVDALGREVVLEEKPDKVALLFFKHFEPLFLLGESPVAAADINVLDDWASLAPYKDNEIADLGSITGPNIEKLLEIDPDVIIMYSGRYENYGEKLEKIAPVITVDSNENDWQGVLREYGTIFGKEQKAEAEIARIEALIADSRERLKAYADRTFAVIMLGNKQYWAYTTQFIFNKDNGLGLNPPSNYANMATKGEQISLEGLAAMNPDYMFVADIGGSVDNLQKYLKDLESDAVWNALDAVKNGHIFALDSSIAAGGPLGIELGVRTIVEHIVSGK